MIVDDDVVLEKSTDVTFLIVGEFNISLENTCGDVSWLNGKNEPHTRIIQNVVRASLLHSNQHEKKGAVWLKHPLKSIDTKYKVH